MIRVTMRVCAAVALAVAGCWVPASAQSSGGNPDFSAVAQFLICPAGEAHCALADADSTLNFDELEVAIQGYLNPYVRGDVFIAFGEGEAEVEEAYASFVRGLGPFQARIGKYRSLWGTVNPLHPHAYSWIFQPLVEERFFGPEGLNQIAVQANWSTPVGDRSELQLAFDYLRGDLADDEGEASSESAAGSVCVGPGCADGICEPGDADCAVVYVAPAAEEDDAPGPEPAYQASASWFGELRPNHSLRIGANALWGSLDPELGRDVTWLGADFKYRWRPDTYRSLNLIGAYLSSRTDQVTESVSGAVCVGPDCAGDVCPVDGVCQVIESTEASLDGTLTTSGAYLIADWQFARRWNVGVKGDWSEELDAAVSTWRAETFVNWRLMEESTVFRLLLRREDGDAAAGPENTAALQFVFSLGPHRPHAF